MDAHKKKWQADYINNSYPNYNFHVISVWEKFTCKWANGSQFPCDPLKTTTHSEIVIQTRFIEEKKPRFEIINQYYYVSNNSYPNQISVIIH